MNVRRLVFPVAACVFAAVSCGPNEQAQTVSFVLSLDSERLSEVRFVVGYRDGKFAGTDGQCEVSAAAGPRSFAESEARLLEKDRVRVMSRPEKRVHAAAVRAAGSTSTTLMTPAGEPASVSAIEPAGGSVCGDGSVDAGEICDDGNVVDDDGCSGDCEFAFSSVDDEQGELTITIGNINGIPPGAALAFCKFQGDLVTADLVVDTLSCDLAHGSGCTPTTDAIIGVSTTTTTTTTTTSSTTTTTGDGDTTSTTSSTLFP